jgi:hypothetical protein
VVLSDDQLGQCLGVKREAMRKMVERNVEWFSEDDFVMLEVDVMLPSATSNSRSGEDVMSPVVTSHTSFDGMCCDEPSQHIPPASRARKRQTMRFWTCRNLALQLIEAFGAVGDDMADGEPVALQLQPHPAQVSRLGGTHLLAMVFHGILLWFEEVSS